MRKIFVLLFAQLIFLAALSLSSCSKTIEDPANSNHSDKDLHPAFSTQAVQSETFTVNGVSFNMMFVPGGTFQMGASPEQAILHPRPNEYPLHEVTLSSNFYMGETEVTQALWQAVMDTNPSYHVGDQLPVVNMSWNDCHVFISRLNQLTGRTFRLPTEAEWEYAARGANNNLRNFYAGGSNVGAVAWYSANSHSMPHPVKSKQPNELGLYDMSGNVLEWCQDGYGPYSEDSQTDPTGSGDTLRPVIRGGYYNGVRSCCRVSWRSYESNLPSFYIGFRLALSE